MNLGKDIKCEACQGFYFFRNKFNKFNNTRARMLDSIYHMTFKLLSNLISVLNYYCFIDFIAWRYFTHRRDFIIMIKHHKVKCNTVINLIFIFFAYLK